MGYGIGAKAVKAAIDKRNAQRELERERQANQRQSAEKTEAQRKLGREESAAHYYLEKRAREIWWGQRTLNLEPLLRRKWELTT